MRPHWSRGGGQEDMEALQTDVMRFMAILGLCLAAIFSLVKSPDYLPPASPDGVAGGMLMAEADLKEPVQDTVSTDDPGELRSSEKTPENPLSMKRASEEPARERASPPAPAGPMTAPLPDAGKLASTTAGRTSKEPLAPSPSVYDSREPVPEPQPSETPNAQQTYDPPATATIQPSSKTIGFELVFASAEDLRRLLTRGGTALYATDGTRFWRWQPGGRWAEVSSPATYYRMDEATLPSAFRRGMPAALAGVVTTWGIDLAARTVQGLSLIHISEPTRPTT